MALPVLVPIRLDVAGDAAVRWCKLKVEADVVTRHPHMW
jgi:hypothetical protein